MICDDQGCHCGTCKPVDYDKLRAKREAQRRRENGGPGRPPWWKDTGVHPDTRPGQGGRVDGMIYEVGGKLTARRSNATGHNDR